MQYETLPYCCLCFDNACAFMSGNLLCIQAPCGLLPTPVNKAATGCSTHAVQVALPVWRVTSASHAANFASATESRDTALLLLVFLTMHAPSCIASWPS